MTQASELRIGNLVDYLMQDSLDDRKEWYEPTVIDWQDLKYLSEIDVKPHYKPIPLTEEWLVKFGFSKITHKMQLVDYIDYRKGNCVINLRINNADIEYGSELFDIEERTYIRTIKYVHQLQNLHYVLTGEELTLKPQK